MLTARDFQLLLPWYLNGTLTGRERDLVAGYLEEHPEEAARVQWHTSLRTGIKGEVDLLPQDIGLERVLGTVRQGASRAPNPRPARAEPSWRVHLAAWLASLVRGRAAWAVALASVTLVAGTIAIFATMMPGPAQSPGTTFAQSAIPARPPDAEQAQRNEAPGASAADAKAGAGATVALASPTLAPGRTSTGAAGPSRRTYQTVLSLRATPKGPLPAPAGPDESNVARRPLERDQQPTSPAPTMPEQSELPQLAQAPAATVTPAPQAGVPQASGSPPSPGPATGLANAREASPATSQSAQQSAVAAANPAAPGTVPETTKLSSTATPERAISGSTSRAAISGKANTSCPSTDKQREDALRAANPDQPVRTPEAWVEYIKELLKAGCRDAADQQWVELQKKYPDVKIPPELETSK